MIGYISGTIIESDVERVLINVSGLGYELTCSQNTLSDVAKMDVVSLYVHTHVREDIIQLFGFSSRRERQLFLSLIKVNGVGPKMAITMLSGAPLGKIIEWIGNNDIKGLCSLPKVGKKTAEQMVLSLKGKLVDDQAPIPSHNVTEQVTSALLNLGYRAGDIEAIKDQIGEAENVQDGIRVALQSLSRRLLGEL